MPEPGVIRCNSCGTLNRVPPEKLRQNREPVCGRCKKPLMAGEPAGGVAIHVTDASFDSEVEKSALPVLIDMWAPWCGPCKMISPIVDELAAELAGRLRVAKMNVDDNPATAERFNIRGIPALLLLRSGREIDRIVGVQPKAEILRRLERAIGPR
ncbi:MAG TPA: thioredoxin [Bryobacteraceae bacterium]|nr:thioredoxin [Bryobacteraceae bacterium]